MLYRIVCIVCVLHEPCDSTLAIYIQLFIYANMLRILHYVS